MEDEFRKPKLQLNKSTNELNIHLGTRKTTYQLGMLSLPGLLQSKYIGFTLLGGLLVILLEIYGLYHLSQLGGNMAILTMASVISILAAIAAHSFQGKISLCKNFNIVDSLGKQQKLRNRIKARSKFLKFTFEGLIFMIAIAKILGFNFLYDGQANVAVIPVLISFALVAYLHIANTGYCVWEIAKQFFKFFNKEEDTSPTVTTVYRRFRYETDDFIPYYDKNVNISLVNNDTHVRMQCKGVLDDSALEYIVDFYDYDQDHQKCIALLGLKAQLSNFEDPLRNIDNNDFNGFEMPSQSRQDIDMNINVPKEAIPMENG